MKKTMIIGLCLAASLALAQEAEDTDVTVNEIVDLRVSVLEVIDVTAEKPATNVASEADPEVDAILDEVEALERDDATE